MTVALVPLVRLELGAFPTVAAGTLLGAGLYFVLAWFLGDPHPEQFLSAVRNRLLDDD
jgi:membrane protein DedA with SNARE-associated domain